MPSRYPSKAACAAIALLAPVLLQAQNAAPSPTASSADEQVQNVMIDAMKAWREGGWRQAMRYFSDNVYHYSPSGASFDRAYMNRSQGPSRKSRAYIVRHLQFLTPDCAIAVGIWRDIKAKPPFDAGGFDFSFVREKGEWKIATMHEAFLQSIDSIRTPAEHSAVSGDGVLTAEERAAGWRALFDGSTSAGWLTLSGKTDLPPGWRIDDKCLVTVPRKPGMALRTQEKYRSFEMSFEWLATAGANSGVKYRVFAVELSSDGSSGDASGFEYQVADDEREAGARVDGKQRSGAIYGVTNVDKSAMKPVGEWNLSRILLTEDRVEHWLNGVLTARYPIDVAFESPIVLQHHNTEVRFRNLKIRPLAP